MVVYYLFILLKSSNSYWTYISLEDEIWLIHHQIVIQEGELDLNVHWTSALQKVIYDGNEFVAKATFVTVRIKSKFVLKLDEDEKKRNGSYFRI